MIGFSLCFPGSTLEENLFHLTVERILSEHDAEVQTQVLQSSLSCQGPIRCSGGFYKLLVL